MEFFRQIWAMGCEDDANEVLDPLRVTFLAGTLVYLFGGIALIAALLHKTWFTHDQIDMIAYGGALAAWIAGLAAYLTGAGAALWMKSKGDAVH